MAYKFWGMTVALLLPILPMQTQAMGYSSNYAVCMSSAGISNNNSASCMSDELKAQDKRVKSYFNIILSQYTADERKAKKKTQKQWFDFRDKSCDGNNQSISIAHKSRYLSCALKMTVQHGNMLEKQSYRYR